VNAVVLNRHGRMVSPSNIMSEQGFSTMETLERLDGLLPMRPTCVRPSDAPTDCFGLGAGGVGDDR